MNLILSSKQMRNNKIFLDERIDGKYKLVAFVSTNNIFNIDDTNNTIYAVENTTPYEITLTNGFYKIDELKTELSTKLNNIFSGTISVSINDNTNKFTITNTNSFYFTFGTNTNNTARKLLGFNESDGTASTTQISDTCIDLNTYKQIFINITENNDKNIQGSQYFVSTFVIQNTQKFGELLSYDKPYNYEQYIKLPNTKSLEIMFHDIDKNEININSDYSIILQKC